MLQVMSLNGQIREGDMLYWKSQQLYMKVVRIEEGSKLVGSDVEAQKCKLVCEMIFPFDPPTKDKPYPVCNEFLRIVDPEVEDIARKLAEEAYDGVANKSKRRGIGAL